MRGHGQAVDIGGRTNPLAALLLRCGIAVEGRFNADLVERRNLGQGGNGEVGQVCVALGIEQNVGWFYVAVDNSGPMGRRQCRPDLLDQRGHPVQRPATVCRGTGGATTR